LRKDLKCKSSQSRRPTSRTFDGEPPREVVGVVADTPQSRGETKVPPLMYALHRQQLVRQRASLEVQRMSMAYVLRTVGAPMALAATVRGAVARVDPAVPVAQVRTVDSYLSAQLQGERFIATLFGIFMELCPSSFDTLSSETPVSRSETENVSRNREHGPTPDHALRLALPVEKT